MFNMGSVLTWAIVRSLLPNNAAVATLAGLLSGFALTSCGIAYLEHNDKKFKS